MTTTESKTDPGLRPITRADEARVRAVVERALGLDRVLLEWDSAGLWRIEGSDCVDAQKRVGTSVALARAGIVPGPEGWCWAATAEPAPPNGPDHDATARMLGVGIDRVRLAWERGDKSDQALLARAGFAPGLHGWQWSATHTETPAWLRDAVIAALPVDGTPCKLSTIDSRIAYPQEAAFQPVDDLLPVLARLVSTGEIEAGEQPGTWRRWGVPDGWAWREFSDVGVELLCRDGEPDTRGVIRAESTGIWLAYPRDGGRAFADDIATPPTLAAAKRAALRACWERGVFAPKPKAESIAGQCRHPHCRAEAPHRQGDEACDMNAEPAVTEPVAEPTPAAPPALTRAEQVRHALLAVLTRNPVEGLARVLKAIDGEGVVPAADSAEAKQAAREIGAVIDGARWSLPDVPLGWGWTAGDAAVHSALKRGSQHVANVLDDGSWCIYPVDSESAINLDKAADPIAAQAAALYAARRAGLFAVDAPAMESATSACQKCGWDLSLCACERGDTVERLPDPAGVAFSPECDAIDRLAVAIFADLDALAKQSPGPRIVAMREAVRDLATLAERLLRAWKRTELAPRIERLSGMVGAPAGASVERVPDLAISALAKTIDTGPAHEEHAEPEPEPEPVDATRWPRAVLARALASLATGDVLDNALDAWGASLIAEARCGLTVPHEVVHQHIADRAYAEEARYLFDVYQAAMRWREERTAANNLGEYNNAVQALCAILVREPKPREPEPHRDVSERIARERDEARLEAEAAERRANAAQRDARELADDRNKAIRRAEKAETELAALRQGIDDMRATWAKGRAT